MNTIRVYNGIPARWVRDIDERYCIWSVVNPALGRHGTTVNVVYQAKANYSNPAVRPSVSNTR